MNAESKLFDLIGARESVFAAQSDIKQLLSDVKELHRLYPKWKGNQLITNSHDRLCSVNNILTNLIQKEFNS